MADKHNIPASSLPELQKIIEGYASTNGAMSLADVSKATSIHSTKISGNAKFLVELGMLTGGASKQATDEGRKYARALEHKQDEIAKSLLVESIRKNEFLSGLVTTIRIKKGMSVDEFCKHVLFAADQKSTQSNRTGARAVSSMLTESGLVNETDGMLAVAVTPESDSAPEISADDIGTKSPEKEVPLKEEKIVRTVTKSNHPDITINISLQIPDSDDPNVYDRFFKAMKENLFPDE